MDATRIAELLQPFLNPTGQSESAVLDPAQLQHISTYIDLLLRWNARINLTAIRQPEEIVTRHFGESLFAARHLFPEESSALTHVIDIGSGAGFPGLPIKIWAPHVHLTLIESTQKKATFLREAIRTLTLTDVNVFPDRAEDYASHAETVTLRAVEHFKTILPIAANLVVPAGRLALLIGETQLAHARDLTPGFTWSPPIRVPLSSSRILAIAVSEHSTHPHVRAPPFGCVPRGTPPPR